MLKRVGRRVSGWLSNSDVSKLAALTVAVVAVLWLFISDLAPLLFGLLLAYLLETPVRKMTAWRWRPSRTLATTVAVFLALLGLAMGAYALPKLLLELRGLGGDLPQAALALDAAVKRVNDYLPVEIELDKTVVADNIGQAGAAAAKYLLDNTLNFAGNLFALILYMVLLPLLVFFLLKDKEIILAYCWRFFSPTPGLRRLWEGIDAELGAYVRGKFIEASIVGSASWATFLFFGMDYAFALATLVGLSVFVPFVGAVAVTFPVVLFAFLQFGWSADFALVVSAYGVIQALDGQVLVPLLFSEIVKIHPAALLTAIVFFGNLWGVWGVFFAIPLAVALKHVINFVERRAEES